MKNHIFLCVFFFEPKTSRKRERDEYDPRVDVYWDVSAYAGNAVSDRWLNEFDLQTKGGNGRKRQKRILGLDNWSCQSGTKYQSKAKKKKLS